MVIIARPSDIEITDFSIPPWGGIEPGTFGSVVERLTTRPFELLS